MSRKANMLVFDDFISGAGTTVLTRPELNDTLGQHDLLGIQAVVDQVTTAAGTITVQIFHSSDQINFIAKNGTAEINAASIPVATTTVKFGSDAGTVPSLGYVRLAITITTATIAHVKVWVTARDNG